MKWVGSLDSTSISVSEKNVAHSTGNLLISNLGQKSRDIKKKKRKINNKISTGLTSHNLKAEMYKLKR